MVNGNFVAKKIIQDLLVSLGAQSIVQCNVGCNNSLDNAIMTSPNSFNEENLKMLQAVAGRVLGKKN